MSFYSRLKSLFSIVDLRSKIIHTFVYLFVFRLGTFIVLPGVDASTLKSYRDGLLGMLDTFLGGAFSNASILGLGIFPYISASIAIQLLVMIVPKFQRMQMEGFSGRKKLNTLTRQLTILISVMQSSAYISSISSNGSVVVGKVFFTVSSIFILLAGTMFCVWLSDRLTDKGIGNGSSLLIAVGIISSIPSAVYAEYVVRGGVDGLLFFGIEMLAVFGVIMFVVAFTQATRKVPIQYSKHISSNYSGNRQYLPFKLNSSGIMPIIFAQTLMFIPSFLIKTLESKSEVAAWISANLFNPNSWLYNILFSLLIILFTFFYNAITINPDSISSDMKRNNSFIPGIQSGKKTSEYIDSIISLLTLPSALFLAVISILPMFANNVFGVSYAFSRFCGGTSILIIVGVVIEVSEQIKSYVLLDKYSGMSSMSSYSSRFKGDR